MTDCAPIVLFAYNRPEHTRQTLEALNANTLADRSALYVYCDGPKPDADEATMERILKTREVVREKDWCKTVSVIERTENHGLARSIRTGVTEMLINHGRIIVLEDDIVTSPGFLQFMNDALDRYARDERVMHIGGYVPETGGLRPKRPFFSRFMSCWGWATWAHAWEKADWDACALYDRIASDPARLRHFNLDGYIAHDLHLKMNCEGTMHTWAIMWFASVYLAGGLCLYPSASMVRNIGLEGSGVHYAETRQLEASPEYVTDLLSRQPLGETEVTESARGRYYLKKFYRFGKRVTLPKELFFLLKTAYESLAHRHV